MAEPAPAEDLRLYRDAVRESAEFRQWIDGDYIPPDLVERPPGLPWFADGDTFDEAPPPEEAIAALRRALRLAEPRGDGRPIILLSPPFCGQTSVLRRLWAGINADAPGSSQLAIFVPLGGYSAQPAGSRRLAGTIAAAVGALAPALGEAVDDLLARSDSPGAGRLARASLIFILDGLDGLPQQQRDEAARELRGLASDSGLAAHRFVVSCRRGALPPALSEAGRVFVLQYLSDRKILRYLQGRRGGPAQALIYFRQILGAQLLDLAAFPPLLSVIVERLERSRHSPVNRGQLLADSLEASLSQLPTIVQRGDAARQSLIRLAWEMSWQPDEALELNRVFAILGEVRRERSYDLEQLYDELCRAGLLYDTDRKRAAFQRPGMRAYCTALALDQRADLAGALAELLPQCAVAARAERWGAALIDLASISSTPEPLEQIVRAGRASNNGLYMVLLARCLQALPAGALDRLDPRQRGALLDACAAWAEPAREPSAPRRAQIATALGRLPAPSSARALQRLLCERIRPGSERSLSLEYSGVRICAAFGLRNLAIARPPAANADMWADSDPDLLAALQAWVGADPAARAKLRAMGSSHSTSLPGRIAALFALGDLAAGERDLRYLLMQIVAPQPAGYSDVEWDSLARSAADALTIGDAAPVAAQLAKILRYPPPLGDVAVGQLIHLAGRVRAREPGVLRWLAEQLAGPGDPRIQARALRSLAWIAADYGPPPADAADALAPALRTSAAQIGGGAQGLLELPTPLAPIDLRGHSADDPGLLYLRRTALESLRWLPGADLEALYAEADRWPIELRRALNRSARALAGAQEATP